MSARPWRAHPPPKGSWVCDEDGATTIFPRTLIPMDETAHAALVEEVSR